MISFRSRLRAALGIPLLAMALAAAAQPVSASIFYRAESVTDLAQGKDIKMTVEAKIQGDKARIDLKQSNNPLMKGGTYILSTDGGKTMLLVDPKNETYAKLDITAMLGAAGAMMNATGGLVKIEVDKPKVEKLLEEDGGTVAGLSTRHLRYRTLYTTRVKIFGRTQASTVDQTQDLWINDEIADAGMRAWLRAEPPATGNTDIDELIKASYQVNTGFPLKSVTVSRNQGEKGKEQVTTVTMQVLELDRNAAALPDSTLALPAGYEEQPLLGEGNPFAEMMKP